MKCNRKKKYEADALACERMQETVEPLVEWFRENQRDLPWRKHVNAYRVWISEIMLQQTRVAAAIPYYERFIAALPNPAALAACEPDALRKLWQGLGYYNRVNNMQKAARIVCEQCSAAKICSSTASSSCKMPPLRSASSSSAAFHRFARNPATAFTCCSSSPASVSAVILSCPATPESDTTFKKIIRSGEKKRMPA